MAPTLAIEQATSTVTTACEWNGPGAGGLANIIATPGGRVTGSTLSRLNRLVSALNSFRVCDGPPSSIVYVQRVLAGDQPSELPVEDITVPTLAIHLKTARAIGIEAPPDVIARAEEVIECNQTRCVISNAPFWNHRGNEGRMVFR